MMETKLFHEAWLAALPPALVREAGFSDLQKLECQAFPGVLCLSSEGAALPFQAPAPSVEKKILPLP